MGCASSKEKVCRNCKARCSPVRRSYSLHGYRKPYDSHHVVSLTSSTLGSLRLDPLIHNHVLEDKEDNENAMNQGLADEKSSFENGENVRATKSAKEEFAMGMIEVKTWSKMIDEKIPKIVPKTPIRTPPGEPEVINAWEMMEGLEDISPIRHVHHFRSFSFQVPGNPILSASDDQPTPRVKENCIPAAAAASDSDTNSNSNSISISNSDSTCPSMASEFDREEHPELASKDSTFQANEPKVVPRTEKLIIYFTSLRGVRKTFEDCCHVRVILKGLGVKIDERDVSMHSGFKEELKDLLGPGFGGRSLPIVFIGKKCIGGADDIRRLNEEGELENTVECCELMDDAGGGGDGNGNACEACGDIRFIPCETCSGSCKIYYDQDEDDEEESDNSDHEYGFQRCPDCNENGLIRCPICCD